MSTIVWDDNDPNVVTRYYYGSVVEGEREYPFTVDETSDTSNLYTTYSVTWVDGEPQGVDDADVIFDLQGHQEKADDANTLLQ